MGISTRTFQRWVKPDNQQDGRLDAKHAPKNKLAELERQRIIKVANEPDYADLPPSKIVPLLADEGRYIASESTFYRVLKAESQLQHRQKSKPVRQVKNPRALAADLMTDICKREGIKGNQVPLHSDNGSPMKGATMLATLQELGVVPSFNRPSVSNDNPYSESLFRTLKYRSEYPEKAFEDLPAARSWVQGFVHWYNHEHLHSAIKFVTPEQRHSGEDKDILARRKQVYQQAKLKHPERWSGEIRNWDEIGEVYLNPENEKNEAA